MSYKQSTKVDIIDKAMWYVVEKKAKEDKVAHNLPE